MEFNATFLICAISFIVFVFIMNQILYKPVAKIVSEREKYIAQNEQNALFDKTKANELIKGKEEKVQSANKKAGKIILEKSNNAKDERTYLLNNAQENFKQNIENNKNSLLKEKSQIKENLSKDIEGMSEKIIAKFLKEGK